jgi:hypothetical protein
MARSWRATRVEHVGIAEQAGTHEVGRRSISLRRRVRVQLEDEPRRRVSETVLRGAQVDPSGDPRRRGRMPQAVERQLLGLGFAHRRQRYALSEVRVEQRPAFGRRAVPRRTQAGRYGYDHRDDASSSDTRLRRR